MHFYFVCMITYHNFTWAQENNSPNLSTEQNSAINERLQSRGGAISPARRRLNTNIVDTSDIPSANGLILPDGNVSVPTPEARTFRNFLRDINTLNATDFGLMDTYWSWGWSREMVTELVNRPSEMPPPVIRGRAWQMGPLPLARPPAIDMRLQRNRQSLTEDELTAFRAILTRPPGTTIESLIGPNSNLEDGPYYIVEIIVQAQQRLRDGESMHTVIQRIVGDYNFNGSNGQTYGRRMGAPLPPDAEVSNPEDPRPFSLWINPDGKRHPQVEYWRRENWLFEPTPEQLPTILYNEYQVYSTLRYGDAISTNLPLFAIPREDTETFRKAVNFVLDSSGNYTPEKSSQILSTFAREICLYPQFSSYYLKNRSNTIGSSISSSAPSILTQEVLRQEHLYATQHGGPAPDPLSVFLNQTLKNQPPELDVTSAIHFYLNAHRNNSITETNRAPNEENRYFLYSLEQIRQLIRNHNDLSDGDKALALAAFAGRGHTITQGDYMFIGQNYMRSLASRYNSPGSMIGVDSSGVVNFNFLDKLEPATSLILIKSLDLASPTFNSEMRERWRKIKSTILATNGNLIPNRYGPLVEYFHSPEHQHNFAAFEARQTTTFAQDTPAKGSATIAGCIADALK